MPNIFFIADTHFGEEEVFRMSCENYRFRTCRINYTPISYETILKEMREEEKQYEFV